MLHFSNEGKIKKAENNFGEMVFKKDYKTRKLEKLHRLKKMIENRRSKNKQVE